MIENRINIYGDNRFAEHTEVREACRGIVIRNGTILLTYEVNTDQWFIPGGGLEGEESTHHIHSNYHAFKVCYEDAVKCGADRFIFLGDYISDLDKRGDWRSLRYNRRRRMGAKDSPMCTGSR